MAELLETLRRAQATAENGEWYLLPERGPAQRQQGLMGVFLARETVAEVVAALERAERVETVAREMLKFGEHDGICTNHDDVSGTEPCLLHAEAFNARREALVVALAPAEDSDRG